MCLFIKDDTCGFNMMAHRIAEEHLNQTVSGEWIGREDPINWLA
jgi:hypothetical protein